tara:strand:+ start:852 stop:1328 length:477 start_codon:yes stop_codon:yes gene_type:complete
MDLSGIASVSRWQLDVFDGRLKIEGRILSVAEAETAGLASGLLLATMASPKELIAAAQASEDDRMQAILKMSNKIKPSQIAKLNEENDRIICKVIKKGSMDGGKTWEALQVVTAEEQQNPKENKIWVGVFAEKDRQSILDNALEGHKEAVDRAANFRK